MAVDLPRFRQRPRSLLRAWRYIPAYWQFNLAMALEYRASFISQVAAMFLNDALWVVFWSLYFTRFPTVAGWGLSDVLTVWSVVAMAFGLTMVLGGHAWRLPALVAQGQLDFFLALPKPVLPHLLVSRMSVFAIGDLLFGTLVYTTMVARSWQYVAAFLLVAVLAAVIFTSIGVIVGSAAFFFGQAEQLSGQMLNGVLSFATYPIGIFDRYVRALLYSVLPAAFISAVPAAFLRSLDWRFLGYMAAAAAAVAAAAGWLFHAGLRRYESGNLMIMRS